MIKYFFYLFFGGSYLVSFSQENLKLWYRQPARKWTEALPIGNGRLGAMVFGKVDKELIQLNESSLWSGGPIPDNVNPSAPKYLPLVQKALLEEQDYQKAGDLVRHMQGLYSESYLPLGDISILQHFKEGLPTSYYRELNLNTAIVTTSFIVDGNRFHREIFSSAKDQVIVIRISSDKPGLLNFLVNASSLLNYKMQKFNNDELIISGKAPAHVDPSYLNTKQKPIVYEDSCGCKGMRFQLRIKAIVRNGYFSSNDKGIEVRQATEAIIFVSAATSFNGFNNCPDNKGKNEVEISKRYILSAATKTYEELLNNHLIDYQQYFKKCSFFLTDTSGKNKDYLPTDERLFEYSRGEYDPGIETLYFQYGRYLLISSSRTEGIPANLQGIWNKDLRPPWSSNFTININTQMNYWPAEVTNLSDLHKPLLNFIKALSKTGEKTAWEFYRMHGWVAHHNTDIWALTNPVGNFGGGDPKWANWMQGGNWLCRHLWEHFQFTGDKIFLKESAYPIMKKAARFCLELLVTDKNNFLVTAPSLSPENVFKYGKDKIAEVSIASTMDMSVVWDLFSNLIEASRILGKDKGLRNLLLSKKRHLYPLQIGSKGNLQEWYKDWEDVEPQHRHVSHLFGLYPGCQISPIKTPAFSEAARKSLEIRGDAGTGWSKAWKINFWARLLDGNHAYHLLRQLLHYCAEADTTIYEGGGTYPNFFDAHPPFQIDGNFGGTAGIAEMLIQSHLNEIHLLPALPDIWKEGQIKGLKARGNYEIDINWNNHTLTKALIKCHQTGKCIVRASKPFKISGILQKVHWTNNGYLLSFNSIKGHDYQLVALLKK